MKILKDFDLAIADAEGIERGFKTEKQTYGTYLSNAAWAAHLAGMSEAHCRQYGDGSGGELEEKNDRPPKMAAFASSSRMIYRLSKDIPGFCFEEQLHTVIGGVANMDGYLEQENGYIFVEAKCREPYSHGLVQTIKQNYKPLYVYLREKMPRVFSCVMEDVPDSRDMRVAFFCKGESVQYFDIKQMICHLLGVANRMLTRKEYDKSILFLYLLYDPTGLTLPAEIMKIYRSTCDAANGYRFEEMFGHIVDYLITEKGIACEESDAQHLKASFCFVLCNQVDYKNYVKE